jgi:hypothetical protein
MSGINTMPQKQAYLERFKIRDNKKPASHSFRLLSIEVFTIFPIMENLFGMLANTKFC